jgi:hypothetical protein
MESLLRIFENQSYLSSLSQIGLDILILGLLAAVLLGKKQRLSKKDGEVIGSLQKIIEETGAISRDFELNLQQRQNMIQQITAGLDQRIREAQRMCDRLEQLSQASAAAAANSETSGGGNAKSRKTDQQKVILLARKGLNASEIARNLRKPVGEVELILNLQKIAP